MSILMVCIDKSNNRMIVIGDKRASRISDMSFLNDYSIKYNIIRDGICFDSGHWGKLPEDMPKKRLAYLYQFADRKTPELISIVKSFDRRYIDLQGNVKHDPVILCGLNEMNEFFILCGQPDGTFDLIKEDEAKYRIIITTNGEHLHRPAMEFLAKRIAKKQPIVFALKQTIKYVSSIEKTVSRTSNYTIINKNMSCLQKVK